MCRDGEIVRSHGAEGIDLDLGDLRLRDEEDSMFNSGHEDWGCFDIRWLVMNNNESRCITSSLPTYDSFSLVIESLKSKLNMQCLLFPWL